MHTINQQQPTKYEGQTEVCRLVCLQRGLQQAGLSPLAAALPSAADWPVTMVDRHMYDACVRVCTCCLFNRAVHCTFQKRCCAIFSPHHAGRHNPRHNGPTCDAAWLDPLPSVGSAATPHMPGGLGAMCSVWSLIFTAPECNCSMLCFYYHPGCSRLLDLCNLKPAGGGSQVQVVDTHI